MDSRIKSMKTTRTKRDDGFVETTVEVKMKNATPETKTSADNIVDASIFYGGTNHVKEK